jgi:PEP-CTERM motif
MRRSLTAAFVAARARSLSHCLSARSRVALAAALFATSLAGGLAPAHASVVLAQVAADGGVIGAVDTAAAIALSFTTTFESADVTISALLYSDSSQETGNATVYLTNSIGAGTTSANEIAKVTLTGLPLLFSDAPLTVVFSGLFLPAGPYFVVASGDAESPGVGWGEATTPLLTTAPGVTINPNEDAGVLDPFYSPASQFIATGNGNSGFVFTITGSPVPEPSAWAMMLLGFAGLGFASHRATRARQSVAG